MFFKLPTYLIDLIYEYEGNILNRENKKKYIKYIDNNIFNLFDNYLLDFSYKLNEIKINNKLTNVLKNISLDLTDDEKKYLYSYGSKKYINFCIKNNYTNYMINNFINKIILNSNIQKSYKIVICSKLNETLNVKFDDNIDINSIKLWRDKIIYIINKNIDIYFDILIINNSITLIINRIIFI